MTKKIIVGILLGAIAGGIDMTPMVVQGLTWDANISAISMWIIAGFFISTSTLKINPFVKGILLSFLCLIPCAIIISWEEPKSILPIALMTLVLGSLLGKTIDIFTKEKNED